MTTARYTKVPLRRTDRWTGALVQEGQVLPDHESNLNLLALGRATREVARDAIGWAGVPAGSSAFQVSVVAGPPRDLSVAAGRMWVDGLAAYAPAAFLYSQQADVPALPASGRVLVYLDAFVEHVQPAEAVAELVDPALAPIETAARQRVGWRVRVAPTAAATCEAAFAALGAPPSSTGRLTIDRTAPASPADPCDPPGDPLGLVPDGLLRVEVLDGGSASTARFAWSYDNGGAAVALAAPAAGSTVELVPSSAVKFVTGDLVEVSWLTRRADRAPHGALYRVVTPAGGPGGQVLTLDRAVTVPAGAEGVCVRRWDGQSVGATSPVAANLGLTDFGVRFTAGAGNYVAGDWWGSRLRAEAAESVERRLAAEPDGILHAYAPLALVDLGAPSVLADCRPTFVSLVDVEPARGQGVCTVTAFPGDDLQAAVDALPADGGELCVAAGTYVLGQPLFVQGRRRVVVSGVGPATVLRAPGHEAVVVAEGCTEIEIRHLRAESGTPRSDQGHLNGTLTFVECTEVRVVDCDLSCPDSVGKAQTCVAVRSRELAGNRDGARPASDRVRIADNRCEVGVWQTGILVVDSGETAISGNVVRFVPTGGDDDFRFGGRDFAATEVSRMRRADRRETDRALAGDAETDPAMRREARAFARTLRVGGQGIVVGGRRADDVRILDNLVDGFVQGIHVATSDAHVEGTEQAGAVLISRNVVHCLVPQFYGRGRHAIFVGNARSVHVLDTIATLRRTDVSARTIASAVALPTPVDGITVHGVLGPFLAVRHSSLRGFRTGVRVTTVPPSAGPQRRMWLVAETMAEFAAVAVDAPGVEQERNYT